MVFAMPRSKAPVTRITPDGRLIVEAGEVAGELGWVGVSSAPYDSRTAAENGCDPDGCVPEYTRVRMLVIGECAGRRNRHGRAGDPHCWMVPW